MTELERVTAQKDAAYAERTKVVAALARAVIALGGRAYLGLHEGEEWEAEWRWIVFCQLPGAGAEPGAEQVSWHIHERDLPLFDFLQMGGPGWDGHTTEEKYRRLAAWAPADRQPPGYGPLRGGLPLNLRVSRALDVAIRYGSVDGAHHKAWVIDQTVRLLIGSEEAYREWREEQSVGGRYEWDEGIAP